MSIHGEAKLEVDMRAWVIERMKQERRDQEWQPQPLHIQHPPPEWIEEQERKRDEESSGESSRGVWIFEF